MGKKYILINGKKHYIKDEGTPAEGDPKPEGEADEEGEEGADDTAEQQADEIAKSIMSKIGLDKIDDLKATVDKLVKSSTPRDTKLMQILNGKDYIKDADKLTKEEKIVGFFHALVTNNEHALKALSEGTDADGGYLFPDEFASELVREVANLNVLRGLVRVVPMKRDVMKIPTLTSSVQVYWTAENATKTTTTAAFGQATLTARKMAAILYASDELIEDSSEIDIVNLIITLFAEAIANQEEYAIARGNGTTQPTGLDTARSAGTIASIAAVSQNFDDVINLEHALPAKYSSQAVYLAHRETIKELRKLKDSDGRYLWQEPFSASQPATFHGKPVYEVNDFRKGDIYFGDFKRGYWLGDRQRMTVKVTQDTDTAFTKDQTAIRVVSRIAGNVVLANCIKVLTGM